MKKRILLTILSFVCVFVGVLGLTACGENIPDPPAHIHNYLWVDNDNGTHKQHCTVSGCDVPDISVGNHDFTNGNCVCGAKKKATNLNFALNEDGNSYSLSKGDYTDAEIIIPSTYNGKPVTIIEQEAFRGCIGLTSIVIPDSVIGYGGYSFYYGCENLASIIVDENNPILSSQDGILYSKNKEKIICVPKTVSGEMVISNGVKKIDWYAFSYCRKLTSLIIPNSVTSIGSGAFEGCKSLTIYCEAMSAENMSWWDNDIYYPLVWDYKNNNKDSKGYEYSVIDGIRYALKDTEAIVVGQPANIVDSIIIPESVMYKGAN